MSGINIDISQSPFPNSPVVPELVEGSKSISFRCYKGIKCFNACCSNIDISLTPYDIVRLKNRLDMVSGEFLLKYTYPYELEKEGIAGVKLKPVENGTACQFMTPEGCSVYEDRPTACRYYPVGLVSIRKQDEYVDRSAYAIVKEPHCLGHHEARTITIDEYRKEQGADQYDEKDRAWRQLILKKKSSGPTVGKPTKRSLQLFFMACYDLDRFREFVISDGFTQSFEIDEELLAKMVMDEEQLMQFALRFLKQVMFGEMTIPVKEDAVQARIARMQAMQQSNEPILDAKEYDPAMEPQEIG
ncbi:MAG TPA: YkgJ family cysteine cluster protein [Gammaproteobacteria bacterium]